MKLIPTQNQGVLLTITAGALRILASCLVVVALVSAQGIKAEETPVTKAEESQSIKAEELQSAPAEDAQDIRVENFQEIAFENPQVIKVCKPTHPSNFQCCLDDWQDGSGCPAGTRLTGTCDPSCNNCGPLTCVSEGTCPTCVQ